MGHLPMKYFSISIQIAVVLKQYRGVWTDDRQTELL